MNFSDFGICMDFRIEVQNVGLFYVYMCSQILNLFYKRSLLNENI